MAKRKQPASRVIRANDDRANTIIMIFYFMIALNILNALNNFTLYSTYGGDQYPDIISLKNSGSLIILMVLSALDILFFIIAAICFLNWFRRAYYNLKIISDKKTKYDDDMAVWSFMIPIISLYRPLEMANEIYVGHYKVAKRVSHNIEPKNENVIGVWWFMFLVLGILGAILTNITGDDNIHEIIEGISYIGIVNLINIPRLIVAILMVKAVSRIESIVYSNRMKLDKEQKIASGEEE